MSKSVSRRTAIQLESAFERAKSYAESTITEDTKKAYLRVWVGFDLWCQQAGLTPLPATPETVAVYLAAHDGLKSTTLEKRLAAISVVHKLADLPSPTQSEVVKRVMRGIRRTHGSAKDQKTPLRAEDLRRIKFDNDRDRALILLGFAGALRRSEVVAINAEDLHEVVEGLVLTVPKSKTDQEGAGVRLGIPYGKHDATCPVKAVQAWFLRLYEHGRPLPQSPVFRPLTKHGAIRGRRLTDKSVGLIVKKYAAQLGYDPADYGGHSLRAGYATSVAAAGGDVGEIMFQTRHTSETVARSYVREGNLFANGFKRLDL